jgi:hypothetical protein
MSNIKKIIAIQTAALVATAFLGISVAQASEVTGVLSASNPSGGSQTSGTISGGNGSSSISGTVSSPGGGGGSVAAGSVSGGGTGAGGGQGAGSAIAGSVQTPSTNAPSGGLVLGASTVAPTPGLPDAGVGPYDAIGQGIASLAIIATMSLVYMLMTYVAFIGVRRALKAKRLTQ